MNYKIEKGMTLRDSNKGIDAIGAFQNVEDEILRFCFLLVDYKSPYRLLPKGLRIISILTEIGFTSDIKRSNFLKKNNKVIDEVCIEYEKLQYSIEHELLQSCKIQINQWNELFRNQDKDDKQQAMAFKIFEKMSVVLSKVKEIEELVGDIDVEDTSKDDWCSLEKYLHG